MVRKKPRGKAPCHDSQMECTPWKNTLIREIRCLTASSIAKFMSIKRELLSRSIGASILKHIQKPAMVIELEFKKDVIAARDQIHNIQHHETLKDFYDII